MAKKQVVSAKINGDSFEFLCEPRQTLLEVLRDVLDMTGTKEGCSNGNCGACTVLMNGRPVVSCLVLAMEAENPQPSEEEIRFYLAGNLCRCTGYDKIVRAVQAAAERRAATRA